jgi:hypothetical protein
MSRLPGIDRLSIALTLLAALLFSAAYLGRAERPPPLTGLAPTQVRQIEIRQHGELRLRLRHRADGWHITHPGAARARDTRVARLLALLRAPSQRHWPADARMLRRSGLQHPVRSVRFDTLRIDFGGPSTPPGLRYVRVNGQIHLVDDIWFQIAGLPAAHYRDQH